MSSINWNEILDEELYRVSEDAKNCVVVKSLDGYLDGNQIYQIG